MQVVSPASLTGHSPLTCSIHLCPPLLIMHVSVRPEGVSSGDAFRYQGKSCLSKQQLKMLSANFYLRQHLKGSSLGRLTDYESTETNFWQTENLCPFVNDRQSQKAKSKAGALLQMPTAPRSLECIVIYFHTFSKASSQSCSYFNGTGLEYLAISQLTSCSSCRWPTQSWPTQSAALASAFTSQCLGDSLHTTGVIEGNWTSIGINDQIPTQLPRETQTISARSNHGVGTSHLLSLVEDVWDRCCHAQQDLQDLWKVRADQMTDVLQYNLQAVQDAMLPPHRKNFRQIQILHGPNDCSMALP